MAAFQFFLHRRCSWACAPDPAERHGKPHCAAPCGRLHARFPWDFLRRKHADRELLVRSLLRRLRGRGDPLRGFEDLPSPSLWKGLVRLDLPDGDGAGLSSLEGPKEPQKTLFRLASVCCICRLPHLCHRLFDTHELFCPSPREVPQNKVHRLREVPSGLPDGCGRYGQHPEAGKILCPPAPEPARTTHCEGKTESSQMKILPECQSRPLYMLISL